LTQTDGGNVVKTETESDSLSLFFWHLANIFCIIGVFLLGYTYYYLSGFDLLGATLMTFGIICGYVSYQTKPG
jgi:hypothetical protein